MNNYGTCNKCSIELKPVYFIEEEIKVVGGSLIRTGRKRRAVSHLECQCCGKKECVDDSFDGNWY